MVLIPLAWYACQSPPSPVFLIRHLQSKLWFHMSVVRFVNLLTENLEKMENREPLYALSPIVNGQRQHRFLTLRDKRTTLRVLADRVCCLVMLSIYSTYLCCQQ